MHTLTTMVSAKTICCFRTNCANFRHALLSPIWMCVRVKFQFEPHYENWYFNVACIVIRLHRTTLLFCTTLHHTWHYIHNSTTPQHYYYYYSSTLHTALHYTRHYITTSLPCMYVCMCVFRCALSVWWRPTEAMWLWWLRGLPECAVAETATSPSDHRNDPNWLQYLLWALSEIKLNNSSYNISTLNTFLFFLFFF